jgi:putative DNA primase/helicase
VANLERDLRGKRSQIKRLRADQDEAMRDSPQYDDAIDVLKHWQSVCAPNAKELTGKRLENVLARLKAYEPAELKRAASGYALKPYVVNGRRTHDGGKSDWRADAELIYRDAGHVDTGLRIMDHAEDLRRAFTPAPAQPEAPAEATTLSTLGEAALRLARYGFFVFPCVAGEKRPATRNGLLDAKRDEDSIRAAWTRKPDLNVAIRTGRESGIVVLDVDGEPGWDSLHALEDEHEVLPDTASVETPSGGHHFYFQHPGFELRNTAGYPGVGLDVRGDGGYVLAPPSVVNGREYTVDEQAAPAPMPAWLLDLLRNRQQKVAQEVGKGRDWGAFISQGASTGERDNRMTQYVGHLFNHGHQPGEVLEAAKVLNAAKVNPPLPDKDLARIVKSIARAHARGAA